MHPDAPPGFRVGKGWVGSERQRQAGTPRVILTTGGAANDFLRVGDLCREKHGAMAGTANLQLGAATGSSRVPRAAQ